MNDQHDDQAQSETTQAAEDPTSPTFRSPIEALLWREAMIAQLRAPTATSIDVDVADTLVVAYRQRAEALEPAPAASSEPAPPPAPPPAVAHRDVVEKLRHQVEAMPASPLRTFGLAMLGGAIDASAGRLGLELGKQALSGIAAAAEAPGPSPKATTSPPAPALDPRPCVSCGKNEQEHRWGRSTCGHSGYKAPTEAAAAS